MTDDRKYYGTGDVIGTISFPNGWELRLVDDGCNDGDYKFRLYKNDQKRWNSSLVSRMRDDLGDEKLEEALKGDVIDGGNSSSTTNFTPTAFACDDCHKTWPWSKNQTPDGDGDICPDCH